MRAVHHPQFHILITIQHKHEHSLTKTALVYCRLDPMDHTPAAQRRLKAIHAHLTATADESPSHLRSNPTAGEFFSGTPSLMLHLRISLWKVAR